MKSLKIAYQPKLDNIDIKDAAAYFERNTAFEYIDMLNWPRQFPYKPDCRFKIARSSDSIFIFYKIVENSVRALYCNDNDAVWEDSCVEFFCKQPDQKSYYNFELNCIGTCLASEREGKNENVQLFSKDELLTVKRYASLGTKAFNEVSGDFEWKLTVQIPFSLIGIDKNNLPKKFKANFYKCADGTSKPHYLSWSLIACPEPDFHKPEFFGDMILMD